MRQRVLVGVALVAGVAGCELVSGLSELEFVDVAGGGGSAGGAGGSGEGGDGPGGGGAQGGAGGSGGQGGTGVGGEGGMGGGPVTTEALFNAQSRYTCAPRGGEVYCWGQTPNFGPYELSPQVIPFPADTVQPLGDDAFCARNGAGELRCWGGSNADGQLGTGDTAPVPTPGPLVALPGPARSYFLKNDAGCAVVETSPRRAYCWGNNDYAVISFPADASPHPTPELVSLPGPVADVDQIEIGLNFACARRGTEVFCWGHNQQGKLGIGTNDYLEHPPTAIATTNQVKHLALRGEGGCIMSVEDKAFCWGSPFSSDGQLVPVPYLDGATGLEGGDAHVCGIKNGDVVCAGYNSHLELGAPSAFSYEGTVTIPGAAASVVAGYWMTCALSVPGEVYCWGNNFAGALGIGSADESNFSQPQLVTLP